MKFGFGIEISPHLLFLMEDLGNIELECARVAESVDFGVGVEQISIGIALFQEAAEAKPARPFRYKEFEKGRDAFGRKFELNGSISYDVRIIAQEHPPGYLQDMNNIRREISDSLRVIEQHAGLYPCFEASRFVTRMRSCLAGA